MRLVMLSLALLASPAAAAPGKPHSPQPAAGAELCLGNRAIRATRFTQQGYFARANGQWYRNGMNGCPLLRPDRSIRSLSIAERQCKGDQLQVYQAMNNLDYGTCTLAEWVPVADAEVPKP